MDPNTRRVVAAAFVVAASCNVYDPSLLVGGGGSNSGENGGKGNGGSSDKGGDGGTAGSTVAGSAGSGAAGNGSGGSAGASSGRGGAGGSGGAGATAGTAGMEQLGGVGNEGGEAGMGPTTGGASGTSGRGGTGGSGGGAGAGGTAGRGGAGSGGAGSGGAGSGGAGAGGAGAGGAGTGGSGGATTGCAALTVALNESTDQARFVVSFSGASNLSTATITIVLYVAAGGAGVLAPYVQDDTFLFLRSSTSTALSGTGSWQTITWNIGNQGGGATGIVLTSILRIGIQVWANAATTGFVDPSVVYIDSITVDTPSTSYPFTTSATVNTTPSTSNDGQPGVMWLNRYTADTRPETLTGTSVAWAACP